MAVTLSVFGALVYCYYRGVAAVSARIGLEMLCFVYRWE